jgi:hypothetical protein
MKHLAQRILDYLQSLGRKKKNPDFFNVHHPDFCESVEPAFTVNGVTYYRFIKETSIPWGRYMFMQTFLIEQELRMNLNQLNGYVQKLKYAIQGKPGTLDVITMVRVIGQMESRVELAFEVDTTYRLASVMYFDDTEDLYTYDKTHNDVKIALWKEAKAVDFFYTRPMSELLGLINSSPEDLQTFIEQQTALLKELTIETPEP